MISRLETMDGLPIPQDPFALRIISAGQSYGLNTPFLDIWQGNGLLISRMDRAVTLAGIPEEKSMEETRLFLAACGGETVLCSRETAVCFPEFSIQAGGPVLVRQQPGKTAPLPGEFPSPRMLYQVLSACQSPSFPVPEFEPFYLDTSHRLRHGTAAAVVLEEAGKPAACALALAVTDTAALLTAVAVVPAFRRNGLGRQAVETLCCRLSGRKVFLFRAEEENQAFYEALGFLPEGNWVQGRL